MTLQIYGNAHGAAIVSERMPPHLFTGLCNYIVLIGDFQLGVEDFRQGLEQGSGTGCVGLCGQTFILLLQQCHEQPQVEAVGGGFAGLAALDAAKRGIVHSNVLFDKSLVCVTKMDDGPVGNRQCGREAG